MATHTIIGYDADALVYDPNTGSFSLDPNYNANNGRVRLEIEDDDTYFDGDRENDEVGEDSNQTGNIYDMDGNLVSSGKIYVEQFAVLEAPDGSRIFIDRIEIGGGKVAYLPSQPLDPNVDYAIVRQGNVDDTNRDPSQDMDDGSGDKDTRMQYNQYNDVPCFAAGMRVKTTTGLKSVEFLKPGDILQTRDHGDQPVVRVLITPISGTALSHSPDLRPITVAAVAGHKPLTIPAKHRMLLEGWEAQMIFGEDAVLAQASHLYAQDSLACWLQFGVCYVHIVLACHAAIQVEGQWSESYFVKENDELLADDEWIAASQNQPIPLNLQPHIQTAYRVLRHFEAMAYADYAGVSPINHTIGKFQIRPMADPDISPAGQLRANSPPKTPNRQRLVMGG